MLKIHTLDNQICAHADNAAHGVEIPPGARLLFTNGQVGARPDGSVPESRVEQLEVIFERLQVVLAAAGMDFSDVVKLTIYMTGKEIMDDYLRVRARHMKDHNPAATILVVGAFPRPGVEVEIEAIAARIEA